MSNELKNVNSDAQLPAYMQDDDILGVDGLSDYVRPPRLKIVQAMSKAPFDEYDKGTILVVPAMAVFSEMDKATKTSAPFKFVPLFFYPEWLQTNPLVKNPFVRERSLDPRSELAKKAKNRDTWTEPHPDDPALEVTNREHMNFIIMPYDHPMQGTPMVLTFSKASFRDGTNLASMIKLRKASIFGQIFEAKSAGRKNDKGEWFGLDVSVPAEEKWVTPEQYETFKGVHLELVKVHAEGLLQVDYDDVPADGAKVVDEASSEF